jgi:hypothetical protein
MQSVRGGWRLSLARHDSYYESTIASLHSSSTHYSIV